MSSDFEQRGEDVRSTGADDSDVTDGTDGTDAQMRLRLYIAGSSPRSRKAVATVSRLVRDRLGGDATLEIVDIYEQREAAKEAQIVGVPTLDRELPPPLRRLIGDLSDERRVLLTLEVDDEGEVSDRSP